MTDNEIIKALECCINCDCKNCPCYEKEITDCRHGEPPQEQVLDLINRLQAEKQDLEIELKAMRGAANGFKVENERLTIDLTNAMSKIVGLEKQTEWFTDIGKLYSEIKAEAYKEFAEKVKEEIKQALESNYKAKAEKEENPNYVENAVWNICIGKINCLRGLDDFLDNLLKETVGDK